MRIRSIKPEFWRSEDVSVLGVEDRLLFIGIWSYVDDNGVGIDRPNIIAADLFADDLSRDPRETLARVSGGLQRLFEAGRIVRYTVDGKPFLAVTNWSKHQRIDRPNKDRYPLPTSDNAEIRDTLATPSRDVRETPATGTGEQRNRGTEEKDSFNAAVATIEHEPANSYPADFLRFYDAYPRHQKKGDALKAFRAAKKRATVDVLVAGAERLRDDPNREDRFTPLPASWLNADGWEDEPLPQRNLPAHVSQFPPRRTATEKAQSIMSMAEEADRLRGLS